MSQTAFGIQARSSVLPSTRLNTKVLPIPSSNCFRHAHLVVLVRRNRLISSYSWELSVRRCLNDGHSEQVTSPNASAPADVAARPHLRLRKYLTPALVLLLAAAVVFTITRNWNSWEGGRIEQVTDDAYVRSDLTPLSTKVAGV